MLRAGIVGVGKLGTIHVRIYKEINEIGQIHLADIRESALNTYPGYPSTKDYRTLAGKVDLVSIATPTETHSSIATFFLKHGIPVLVEKPIAQTLTEAQRLIALAQLKKTLMVVGHVERYNNAYLAIKEIVKRPLFIECHRLSPYPQRSLDISVILDLMIHDIDIILELSGDTVKKIEAKAVTVLSATDDIANARLTFSRGCVANITASRISAKRERKIRIFAPDCYVSLDYAEQKAQIYKKVGDQIESKLLVIDKEEPLKKEIANFVRLVEKRQFTITGAMQAKEALRIALRIQKISKGS